VDLDDFFTGYRQIDRQPDELMTAIRINKCGANQRDWFCKVGTRKAQSIAKVVMGARAGWDEAGCLTEVRIAAGSVAATTVRMPKTEAAINGQTPTRTLEQRAKQTAAAELSPIDDVRSTAHYRATVTGNLAARFVRALRASVDGNEARP
jgi:xanthine dehydrogenase small subunit